MRHVLRCTAFCVALGLGVGPAQGANVALNKVAKASASFGSKWAPTEAIEGGSAYWLAPSGSTGEFITVNLGARYNISEVGLINTVNSGSNDSGTENYRLYFSNDGVSFSEMAQGSLPWDDTTETTHSFSSATARFVRFQADSYFDTRAGLEELRVEGTLAGAGLGTIGRDGAVAANTLPGGGVNIALGKPVTASASFGSPFGGPGALTDGSAGRNTSWAVDGTAGYATVDLLAVREIGALELINTRNDGSTDSFTYDFRIELSTDGSSWTTVLDDVLPQRWYEPWQFVLDGEHTARYVRFHADGMAGNAKRVGLGELRVFIPEPASGLLVALGGVLVLRRPRTGSQPPRA